MEAASAVVLLLNILALWADFSVACVLVHRWRGETGRRRGGGSRGAGRGRDRTGEVLGEVWVEMGRGDERDGTIGCQGKMRQR